MRASIMRVPQFRRSGLLIKSSSLVCTLSQQSPRTQAQHGVELRANKLIFTLGKTATPPFSFQRGTVSVF